MRHLLLSTCLLLAGCVAPPLEPPAGTGWVAVDGLDGIWARLETVACDAACTFRAQVRNEGPATYLLHDDCAQSWYSWTVRDEDGQVVTPLIQMSCAMCSSGGPFGPGESRQKEWTWDGKDHRKANQDRRVESRPGNAPAGTYTLALAVVVDAGEGKPCAGGPYFMQRLLAVFEQG